MGARGRNNQHDRQLFVDECMADALRRLAELENRIPSMRLEDGTPFLYTQTAKHWNKEANIRVDYKVNDYWFYGLIAFALTAIVYQLLIA